jgi:hypothetical protein
MILMKSAPSIFYNIRKYRIRIKLFKAIWPAIAAVFTKSNCSVFWYRNYWIRCFARWVGISFFKKRERIYVPFPDQEEAQTLIEKFIPFFENESIEKIGQNLKYENFLTMLS